MLQLRVGDKRVYVSMTRVPFFVQWLVRRDRWSGDIKLNGPDEAAELAVETAMDADTPSLKRLLADCELEPSSLEGTWMDRLRPHLQKELRKKFREFLQPELLRLYCVQSTTTERDRRFEMGVKATFILDEDNWGWGWD
jgi:hypothetical protein